jgi:FkbM family methyltransferase
VTGLRSTARRVVRRARHRRQQRRMAGPRLIAAFAEVHPHARFVEVGSNDGEQHDHLRPYILGRNWTGVMVEPVPYVFERLQHNYAAVADRVRLANVAVADHDGEVTFFHLVAPPDDLTGQGLPDWYDGIGSLSRENLLRHADTIADVEDRLVETRVPCLTLDSLLARNELDAIDLLLIDVEGHDWEILRTVDLERWRPRMIVYEHFHLDAGDRAACRAHLERAGYETMEEGFDTFCVDPRPDDALTRAWRRARPAVAGVAAYEVAG